MTLGAKVDDFTIEAIGVRAIINHGSARRAETDCNGAALIGADGLWLRLRALLGDSTVPHLESGTAVTSSQSPAADGRARHGAPSATS